MVPWVRSMPDPMTPADRLNAISEQGLCIGCGLCQSVAGPDRIQVVKNQEGNLRPIVTGELDHRIVDQVYDVCPGTHVQGMPAELIGRETKVDNVWGPWRRIVRAWAADPKIRFEGATGGVLTALAGYLLSSGRVSFVLHTQTSTTEPAFGERRLSFTQADVLNAAGSRYGPTATLIDIGDVLDRREPFAFIGKPCDIGALRNYARHDARVNEFVTYWLTLVCGGFMPTPSRDDTLRRFGVEPEDVTGLRYRGRGCPGPTTIETKAGPREMHYLDFWGEDSSQWSLPFRCKICPDGIGESADLAAADSWPGGSPNRIDSETDPGTNAVIVRTAAGLDLIEAAARDGALVIEYDQTPDDMSFYQTHQMRKKYAVWPRLQGLADEGHIMPRYQGLRLEELSAELPAETNDYQRQGTRRRVRDGKVSEATPRPAE